MLGLISEAQLSGGIRVVPDWQYGAETQAGLIPASLPAGPVITSLVLEVIFKDSLSHSSVTIPANTGCPDALPLTLWPDLCLPFPGAEPNGYATVPGLFANLPISEGERLFLSFQAVGEHADQEWESGRGKTQFLFSFPSIQICSLECD